MATLCGLTIVKSFKYRADLQEEFSNQYWFKSSPPGDPAAWDQLMTDIYTAERPIYTGNVTFVRAYGYDDDSSTANHVYAFDFTQPGPPPTGSLPEVTGRPMAGDQAALVEWKTDHLNERGKPIYLRKYHHAGLIHDADADDLDVAYVTKLHTYGEFIRLHYGGLTNPTSSKKNGDLAWPGGAHTAKLTVVPPYVTTRTLKRRGPRPKTQA